MLEYKDDKLSKTGENKMERKSRSRKCFDVLEKVTKLQKKKEKIVDRESRSIIICFDAPEKVTQL